MARYIPVTKEVIIWARESRGLDSGAAAERLKVSEEQLDRWESGLELPMATQFKRMVTLYRRSPAILLLPIVPVEPPPPRDFRFVAGAPQATHEAVPEEVVLAIREAQAVQADISELVEDDPTLLQARDHIAEGASTSDDPAPFALSVRALLRMTLAWQRHWTRDDSFKNWRTRVQEYLGVLVLAKKMPVDRVENGCLGFSLYGDSDLVHTIAVNKDDPIIERQTFTLFHEYGHLLLHQAAMCLAFDRQSEIENWCSEFAGQLLVQEDDLILMVHELRKGQPRAWSVTEVQGIARELRVSKEVVAIRLENMGCSYPGLFDEVSRYRQPLRERGGGFASSKAIPALNEFGIQAASIVLQARQKQLINTLQASEILNLKPRWFSDLERRIGEQRMEYIK